MAKVELEGLPCIFLGRGCEVSEPESDGSDVEHGEVVLGVAAGRILPRLDPEGAPVPVRTLGHSAGRLPYWVIHSIGSHA